MSHIAYYRVSTTDQSIEAQRIALGKVFDKEFSDVGSGSILALKREGFSALLEYIREGDSLYVYAIDRLGRDALDVQTTIRTLLTKGVEVHVHGLGVIASGVGELITAVLAQVADMERQRIIERCAAGRQAARASLIATGKTHKGKNSLGRPKSAEALDVLQWRKANKASISATASYFGISTATVSRYCRSIIS
jgi:putative DNA-invertase from lambdoid prophage Rac